MRISDWSSDVCSSDLPAGRLVSFLQEADLANCAKNSPRATHGRFRMPKFSTARETLARLEKRIAEERDPRRKAWLSTYRNHWWGEVIGDVDQVIDRKSTRLKSSH